MNNESLLKRIKFILFAAIVVILDQISKQFINSLLIPHTSIPIIPYLNLTLGYNHGVAFGLFSDNLVWQRMLFIVIALLISLILIIWLWCNQSAKLLEKLGYSLILGGAIGNLIDRLIYGYVIDFIDVYYQTWHWYTFNLADIAICCGAICILFNKPQRKL